MYSYDEDITYLKKVKFSVLDRKTIREGSALTDSITGIISESAYSNGEPKTGGLLDPRMGVSTKFSICGTCGLRYNECPGHFGHLELESPLYNTYYVDYIKNILEVICIRCSKVLITHSNKEKILEIAKMTTNEDRMQKLLAATKNVKACAHENGGCGTPKAKIKKMEGKNNRSIYLIASFDDKKDAGQNSSSKTNIFPNDCANILKKISDDDCRLLGFGSVRPENMITETLLIPPVQIRPSVNYKNNFSDDDLTKKLSIMASLTKRMTKKKKDNIPSSTYNDSKLLSQYHYMTYLNNNATNSRSESGGKPTSSITSRLSTKEGRFRNNLLGKRIDFAARTVITPDTGIKNNEIRTPRKIAMILTKPVRVTSQNIDTLSELVKNGRDKYPGAVYVFKKTSNGTFFNIELRYGKNKVELAVGDIVERHLQDGDIVLVNRQPSLHKLSMLGHKIVVSKDPTINSFGLNPAVTTPYNADFDGDEMNIHAPQSEQTIHELMKITSVEKQLLTPRDSSPIIGIVQDGLLGAYLMTGDDIMIDWREAMNMISICELPSFPEIKKEKKISGKDLFSYIIPEKITINTKDIKIEKGKIISGIMDKSMLKAEKKKSLIHSIWGEYDCDKTRIFIDNVQWLVNKFNAYHGFTTGIEDVEVDKKTNEYIKQLIESKKLKVKHITTKVENNPDIYNYLLVEQEILKELDSVRKELSSLLMNTIPKYSGIYTMVKSGAKGSDVNVCQMSGCVGMQSMDDGRITPKVNGRTLCCYPRDDTSAESTGFVENSFNEGCKFGQYIIHILSGRIGIVAKVIGTADTGYKQRKFIKFLEDFVVKYDMTVRDAKNRIYQLVYGDNSLNPVQIYENSIHTITFGDKDFEKQFLFTESEQKKYGIKKDKMDKFYKKMLKLRNKLRFYLLSNDGTSFQTTCNLAFDIKRIIDIYSEKSSATLDLNYVYDKLFSFCEYSVTSTLCMSQEESKNKSSPKYVLEKKIKQTMIYCVFQYLSPTVIAKENLSKKSFDNIFDTLVQRYNKNVVSCGEAVGIVAAQSCGEVLTQLQLNTFHKAGLGGTSSGVDRLNEIMNATKKIKTPQMVIHFDEKIQKNEDEMKKIVDELKYTIFHEVVNKGEIIYEPYQKFVPVDGKMSFGEQDDIDAPFIDKQKTKQSCQESFEGLPWLLRFTLNKEKMIDKSVTLESIQQKLCEKWRNRNAKKKKDDPAKSSNKLITGCAIAISKTKEIIHIRFSMKNSSAENAIKFMNYFSGIIIKGISGINLNVKNNFEKEEIIKFDKDGMKKENVMIVKTIGVNMTEIRNIKNIDHSKTTCNDIFQVYKYFGIEAARDLIVKEYYNAYGGIVSYYHLSVIADMMTNRGKITKIFRTSMKDLNVDTLANASFEETVSTLIESAVLQKEDKMENVSSRIIAGLLVDNGTGIVKTSLNYNMIVNTEQNENENFEHIKTFNNYLTLDPIVDEVVNKNKFKMDFIPQ